MSGASPLPPGAPAPIPRADFGRSRLGLVSALVSGGLLVALFRSIDIRLVGQALAGASPVWLVISVAMIVPITVLRAIRFLWVAPAGTLPGIREALRLTLVASALNAFAPAKTGDLIKSYFVAREGGASGGIAVAVIVYERLCDLFGLIFWCMVCWFVGRPVVARLPVAIWPLLGAVGFVCGALISSPRAAGLVRIIVARTLSHRRFRRVHDLVGGWPDLLHVLRARRGWVILFSIMLWLVHLMQIWMFAQALLLQIPFAVCASLSALALMAGQVPFTLAGLGARDVALVVLLSRYIPPESAAALGLLTSTRGILPALVGAPMMRPYLSSIVGEARRWRRGLERAGAT